VALSHFSILHWTTSPFNIAKMGGIEVMEHRWLHYFSQNGFRVELYAPKVIGWGDGQKLQNISQLYHCNFLMKYDIFYYLQFLWKARKSDTYLASNAPLVAIFRPKKTVIFFHNFITYRRRQIFLPFYSFFKKRYQRTRIIFCSQFLLDEFLLLYPDFPKTSLSVVFNSVLAADIFKRTKPFGKIKKILFVGQWNHDKGVDVFLDAVKLLRNIRSDFDVSMVGSATLWNNKVSNAISVTHPSYIQAIGVLQRKELLLFMRSCDILVVPSRWKEPFGLVAIEGLSAGLIVLSSGQGGLRDSIIDQINGVVFSPLSSTGLMHSLETVLDLSVEEQMRLRENGYATLNEKFDFQKNMALLTQVLLKR